MIYFIPISFAIFGLCIFLATWWYIRLRQRWHEKGILPFDFDGHDPKQNPAGKTLFDYFRAEREYDRRKGNTK